MVKKDQLVIMEQRKWWLPVNDMANEQQSLTV